VLQRPVGVEALVAALLYGSGFAADPKPWRLRGADLASATRADGCVMAKAGPRIAAPCHCRRAWESGSEGILRR